MGLGGCILLIAAGAILAFATDWEMDGINLTVTGLIMMAVGVIGVAAFTNARRKTVVPPGATVIETEDDHHRHGL
ncbi:hypothetical protein GCM10010277_44890 [Streptomyces longisporoflavus]|uniref:DUF6458 family protein n=1 Tax=Streptomyces longisporoflavus TaxID=28044 RepID=UPI00167D294F|nr:DUF6458 family protein [Streptomyces longisporoflavus]GGV50211.1 hypothetical protein GCM10010277_44890 [Streptomyces longisporoflavus]